MRGRKDRLLFGTEDSAGQKDKGGERIRTAASRFCRPLPYHLGTPPDMPVLIQILIRPKRQTRGRDVISWSGRRDSNPRPQPWQGCALPAELHPRYALRASLPMFPAGWKLYYLQYGIKNQGTRKDKKDKKDPAGKILQTKTCRNVSLPYRKTPPHHAEGRPFPDTRLASGIEHGTSQAVQARFLSVPPGWSPVP